VADNPYRIEGPALLSDSGGRSSGRLLWEVIQAHGGKLPDDIFVCFVNTGKEREEALRFVHDQASHWGVRVHWLEYRDHRKRTPVEQRFEEVDFNSAARNGEPFAALIRRKKALPNQQQRWCTELLKVDVMHNFMEANGFRRGTYTEIIGLRADERPRYLRMLAGNDRDGRRCVAPMVQAGLSKRDVMAFWRDQPFDLQLQPWEGNCDWCFLKGEALLAEEARREPDRGDWWERQETERGATFSKRFSIAELRRSVRAQPMMKLDEIEFDGECGMFCAGDAAPNRGCGRRAA
jgi:3'-phosphoadenosine 5'-phosphosulfate sulfotransferase (PAPS reductase)/FAD synthetase